ncbi:tyrosine-type recombinase/integrase [Martelella alba]|uniref:tyrosine-type recombinase/integrase n=1 Tax=Martelella alba TaxID=2590451 RepID=UPI001E433412|nr:tyrosine-type recombinase/integrase [Martelella alba]
MLVSSVTVSVNCWCRISIQLNSAPLKGIEKKGLLEVAARTRQHMCNVMRHAEHQELIFPGDHNPYKPMCENTINKALRLMGYDTKDEICGHGFRTMACSALMESGLWSLDAVDRQMSHQARNTVRMAYIHKAEHLEARQAMMQWWSDYLDTCCEAYIPPYILDTDNSNAAV